MPTYAYACTACGHAFDIHQSFADDALTVCPECDGRLRKVFSSVGVSFKGSGFYRNDSRTSSTKKTSGPSTSTSTSASAGPSSSESSSSTTSSTTASSSGSSSSSSAPAASS